MLVCIPKERIRLGSCRLIFIDVAKPVVGDPRECRVSSDLAFSCPCLLPLGYVVETVDFAGPVARC
jgi:hypothetical protein